MVSAHHYLLPISSPSLHKPHSHQPTAKMKDPFISRSLIYRPLTQADTLLFQTSYAGPPHIRTPHKSPPPPAHPGRNQQNRIITHRWLPPLRHHLPSRQTSPPTQASGQTWTCNRVYNPHPFGKSVKHDAPSERRVERLDEEKSQGKGYGEEAVRWMLGWGFQVAGFA